MKTPREMAHEILAASFECNFGWVHQGITIDLHSMACDRATAAIEARDAAHAAGLTEAVRLLRLMQRAAADAHCGLRVVDEFLAAAPAVVPAETPPGETPGSHAFVPGPTPDTLKVTLCWFSIGLGQICGNGIDDAVHRPVVPAPAVTPVPEGVPATRHARYLDSTFCDPDIQLAMADAAPTPKDVTCLECRRLLVKNGLHPRTWDAATPPTPSAPPAPEGPRPFPPRTLPAGTVANGTLSDFDPLPKSTDPASAPPREGMGQAAAIRCGSACGAWDCIRRCVGVDGHDRIICRCENHGGGSPPRASK